jgi:HSP20 family protein
MTFTRWYPVRDFAAFQNRVNTPKSTSEGETAEPAKAAPSFIPAVDIFENDDKIVVKLEIPGVAEQDVDIRIENQTLTVRGERKFEAEEKAENFKRIESSYGNFVRAFTLPTSVDTESVQADYKAGVLKLELKKKASAQPRQIKINVAA